MDLVLTVATVASWDPVSRTRGLLPSSVCIARLLQEIRNES